MKANDLKAAIIGGSTGESALSGQRVAKPAFMTALALVYLADKIESSMSDIGPAIKDGSERMSLSTDDVGRALSNIGAEFTGIVSALEGS